MEEMGIIGGDVDAIEQYLQQTLQRSPELNHRQITLSTGQTLLIAYLSGLVDATIVDQDVIAPLLQQPGNPTTWDCSTLLVGQVQKVRLWVDFWLKLLLGQTAIFISHQSWAWMADTAKIPHRAIGRPETEATIRGPQEALTDLMLTQIAQIRRRVPNPRLTVQQLTLGIQDHHRIAVLSIQNIANPSLVKTTVHRIRRLKLDSVINATQIGGLIRDYPRSIFPTVRYTEHVSMLVWALFEGRCVILVDGDPFAIIVPAPLWDYYRTPMDYNSGWYDVSFVRLIRLIGLVVTLYFPALYIVFTTTNRNLVPYQLLTTMMGSHTGLPFPPILEAFIMIFVIEIIREAALRLPRPLSSTLGTMGAIVVGTAVVRAGFVSNQVIVIIALTALSIYSVPAYELVGTLRILSIGLLIVAQAGGLFGLIIGTLALLTELVGMESFGIPYLTPWVPVRWSDWKDTLLRIPWSMWQKYLLTARPKQVRWKYSPTKSMRQSGMRRNPSNS